MGDVLFASHQIAILKRTSAFSSQLLGQIIHAIIHSFLAGALLIFCTRGLLWLKGAVYVFSFHLIIDVIRSNIEIRIFGPGEVHVKRSEFIDWLLGKSKDPIKMNFKSLRLWFLINILDQFCHVISLFIISLVLS